METIIIIIKKILLIGIFYFYSKFGFKIIMFVVKKFFNEKTKWNNLIDNPRILLYLISIALLLLSFDDNILSSVIFKFYSLIILIFSESSLFLKINRPSKTNKINRKKLLLFLNKYLSVLNENHINSINKIVNNQISEISPKSLVSETSNKRELGRIFFQLMKLNILSKNEVKTLYNNIIFRHQKVFLSSDDYHDHNKIFKNNSTLYKKLDIKKQIF